MNLEYYLRKSKDVRTKDYLSVFPMLAGLLASLFCARKYSTTWAVSERSDEARDNGYHFFKYLCQQHPEQPCVYVCDRASTDYRKVIDLGKVIQPGSVRHWILYFRSRYLISSQKFAPSSYMVTLIERLHLFRPDHIFLQHGITKDMADFLLAGHRNATYFIAGAKPEYDFMKENFGYPEGTMQYTGFARFDALHEFKVSPGRILVMPTWRKWLRFKSEAHADVATDIVSSDYFVRWKELLRSDALCQMIDQYHLDIVFYAHPNMKGVLDAADLVDRRIRIAKAGQTDLQELMKTSNLLITDYSSVFFDMVYMKKPVIFYQFDEEQFRKYHYRAGWFDYHRTAFGPFCCTPGEVVAELQRKLESSFAVSVAYLAEHRDIFPLYDQRNCERIYQLLADTEKS